MELIKNKIVIYTGSGQDKKMVVLYNFQLLKHLSSNGQYFIKVRCGEKDYYFKKFESVIDEIEIYK